MPTMGIPLTHRPEGDAHPVLGLGVLDARLHGGTILLYRHRESSPVGRGLHPKLCPSRRSLAVGSGRQRTTLDTECTLADGDGPSAAI